MVYADLQAIRQIDIKKIIALSSIVHMSFGTIGLLIPSAVSIESGYLMMLGHGFISAGLFYCVGCIYDRYKTRDLNLIGSLWHAYPMLSFFLFFFIMSNMSFPGTINFVPELGIFFGTFSINHIFTIFLFFGYFFNTVFNIWLLSRILYGAFTNVSLLKSPEDLAPHEYLILSFLALFTILFGLFPQGILNTLTTFDFIASLQISNLDI
jgi:NADH-quinone oxidoreductase subunit M